MRRKIDVVTLGRLDHYLSRGENMILFPEFVQPESFCQKEYVLHPED